MMQEGRWSYWPKADVLKGASVRFGAYCAIWEQGPEPEWPDSTPAQGVAWVASKEIQDLRMILEKLPVCDKCPINDKAPAGSSGP